MKPEQIIADGDELLLKMAGVNRKLYDAALKIIQLNIKEGRVSISPEDLAAFEDVLYGEIKESDYEENLTKYLTLFDALLASIDQEQVKLNKTRSGAIRELWATADNNQDIIDKVLKDLGRSGVKEVMLRGIADAVREVNYFNLDYKSAVAVLKDKLYGIDGVDESYVQRYVKQVAIDALSQYDGAIQDKVRTTYGYTRLIYSTNTIETSRPFCVRLHDELGGELTIEQLKQELDKYCPNGVPSEKKIKYKVHTGEVKEAKMGAGMIPGTNLGNFSQLRGGYGPCRHRALWKK